MKTRLYVGHLPQEVDEDFIKNRFSKFVKVLSVELKHRHSSLNENDILSTFAFVDIQAPEEDISKCLKKLSKKKWLKKEVTIQLAKESVISRLESERINANKNFAEKTKTGDETSSRITVSQQNLKSPSSVDVNTSNSILTKLEMFSDVWKDSDSETETKYNKGNLVNNTSNGLMLNDAKCEIKTFKNNFNCNMNNKTDNYSEDTNGVAKLFSKQSARISDEKRLKSVQEMKNVLNERKQAIKKALSSVDSNNSNKKILFNDDLKENSKGINTGKQDVSSKNNQLFDDDSDNGGNSYNFNIKNQYDGTKGKKLFELQSRFNNDKRFTMDERFYDSGDEEIEKDNASYISAANKDDKCESTETTVDEIKKQMEILQSIVGDKDLSRDRKKQKVGKPVVLSSAGVRFDPSIPEHEKFIVKPSSLDDSETNDKPKAKRRRDKNDIEESSTNIAPSVSKETFYEVADELKETFKSSEKSSFSFSNLFRSTTSETDDRKKEPLLNNNNLNEKKNAPYNKYDDDRFGGNFSEEQGELSREKTDCEQQPNTTRTNLWTEKFFYDHNDPRYKEAHDFFSKENIMESENHDFEESRQELKRIIKKKVMNKTQKERLFKKKIGKPKFRKNFQRRK